MESGPIRNYFVAFLLVLTVYLVWPLAGAVIFGIFTSYILVFVKENLDEVLEGRKGVSGAIIVAVILIVVIGFIYGLFTGILSVARNYEAFFDTISGSITFILGLLEFPEPALNFVDSIIGDISEHVKNYLFDSLRDAPQLFISGIVFVATTVYFFFLGDKIRNDLFYSLEKLDEKYAELIKVFVRSIYDLFNGVFLKRALMSFSVFVIAGIGFLILGVDFWLGWAILIGIVNFIPLLSNVFVYIPLGILYLALGFSWTGIAIIVFGLIFVDTLPELFLAPKIDVPNIKENPFLIFIGLIAGVEVLGVKGVLLGPAILVMFRDMVLYVYRQPT